MKSLRLRHFNLRLSIVLEARRTERIDFFFKKNVKRFMCSFL